MILDKLKQCYKIVKEVEERSMSVDQVIECIKFCNHCEWENVSYKEILEQMKAKPEKKAGELKSEMVAELDKAIISICKGIQNNFADAELVKSLADLVEVRTCMPDWKDKLGADISE